jgi:hypothetical protein
MLTVCAVPSVLVKATALAGVYPQTKTLIWIWAPRGFTGPSIIL